MTVEKTCPLSLPLLAKLYCSIQKCSPDFVFQASHPPKQSCDEIPNKHSIWYNWMNLGQKTVLSRHNRSLSALQLQIAFTAPHALPQCEQKAINTKDSIKFLPHRPAIGYSAYSELEPLHISPPWTQNLGEKIYKLQVVWESEMPCHFGRFLQIANIGQLPTFLSGLKNSV